MFNAATGASVAYQLRFIAPRRLQHQHLHDNSGALIASVWSLVAHPPAVLSTSSMADNEELLDYEEDDNQEQAAGAAGKADASKKGYVGIHSTSFKDMLLKEPLFDAIQRCGFEHPSEGEERGAITTVSRACHAWDSLLSLSTLRHREHAVNSLP